MPMKLSINQGRRHPSGRTELVGILESMERDVEE